MLWAEVLAPKQKHFRKAWWSGDPNDDPGISSCSRGDAMEMH